MERLTALRLASLAIILASLLGLALSEWSLCRIVDTRFSAVAQWSVEASFDGSFHYSVEAVVRNNGSLTLRATDFWIFLYLVDPNPFASKRYYYEATLGGMKLYNIWQVYRSPGTQIGPGSTVRIAENGNVPLGSLGPKLETVTKILEDYGNESPSLYVYAVLRLELETPGGGNGCPVQLCILSFESGPAPKSPAFGGHG